MHSPHKHSYLQSRSSGVNPRIINRSIDLARSQATIDEHDLNPPFLRLCSEQPNIPIDTANVDLSRRPVAFGRWALPKLRRELHSKDSLTVVQAINSIIDLVHDPEKGYQAIQLHIPDRMYNLLTVDEACIRERTCMALTIMAGLGEGRDVIVKNKALLENIAIVIEDVSPAVRIKAAALIEMISRTWMAADELVWHGFIPILLDNLEKEEEEITGIHLKSLKNLMYGTGKTIAIEHNALTYLINLLERENPSVRAGAAECIEVIATTQNGKDIVLQENVLPKLNKLLHDERPEVYTAAAAALMFCTIMTKAKIKARHLQGLPERLLILAKHRLNVGTQIYCVKVLTNLCEHPEMRDYVVENHWDDVRSIPVQHLPELKIYKDSLVRVLRWLPDSST